MGRKAKLKYRRDLLPSKGLLFISDATAKVLGRKKKGEESVADKVLG